MILKGVDAIAYAELQGYSLNKAADRIDGPRAGLTVAEAEAIATEDPDLIWLEVPDDVYYGEQTNLKPER